MRSVWITALAIVVAGPTRADQEEETVEALAKKSGCLRCHGTDRRGEGSVGPAFRDIAARYGDRDQARQYDLDVVAADKVRDLPERGKSQVVVGRVGDYLHLRIFDAEGRAIVDKGEPELVGGRAVRELKARLPQANVGGAPALSGEARKAVIDAARRAAGLDPARARAALVEKVKRGGKGNWTHETRGVPMPPYSGRLTDAEIRRLVDWVLSRS